MATCALKHTVAGAGDGIVTAMSFAATATSRPPGVISGAPAGIRQPVAGGVASVRGPRGRGGSIRRSAVDITETTASPQRTPSLTSAVSVFLSGIGAYHDERTWMLSSPSFMFVR